MLAIRALPCSGDYRVMRTISNEYKHPVDVVAKLHRLTCFAIGRAPHGQERLALAAVEQPRLGGGGRPGADGLGGVVQRDPPARMSWYNPVRSSCSASSSTSPLGIQLRMTASGWSSA